MMYILTPYRETSCCVTTVLNHLDPHDLSLHLDNPLHHHLSLDTL